MIYLFWTKNTGISWFRDLKKKGFKVSALNKTLALKPSNGKIIDNPIGTARGLHFSSNKKEIIALPGVPSEMKSMMREATLPMIKKISQKHKFLYT